MADAALVENVKLHLPDEPAWDDSKIGSILDSGSSVAATVAMYYSNRMANTAKYVDVNESGSVRSLSVIWQHYSDMYDKWQARADRETELEDTETQRRGITFGKISRTLKTGT